MVGDWAVSPAQNLIERDGQSAKLKPRAMDVLIYLANHAGEVISADELISSVWQGRVVGDGTIYQSINQLRRVLGDSTEAERYIETIAKRGYRLVAPVLPTETSHATLSQKRIKSVAVLPFVNLSSDPEQEYFVDGMTEVLIANLARLSALRVISRTSAMRYKESNASLPEIAKELDVDAVVEGSVLLAGQKVRITIQLIRAAMDQHVWSANYERDLQDVLLLQSEVAQSVTQEIEMAVTPEEEKSLASAPQVNPKAFEAYLRGRFYFYKVSPADIDKALEYFNLALESDPGYAPAYARIGDVWGARGCFGFVYPHEAYSIGNPAARKAVELDDKLAEGHEILARYKLLYEWDWAGTDSESQQAIALNPNHPDVGFARWLHLMATKRFADATERAQHALKVDPFNMHFQWIFGWQLLFERRYNDAIERFNKILTTQPDSAWVHWTRWSALHRIGKNERALADAKQYFLLVGLHDCGEAIGRGRANGGYQSAMFDAAVNLVETSQARYVQPTLIARLYAHAGDKESALDWLERACEIGEPWSVWLDVDVDWDDLREEPRFAELLREIGLGR